jgi:hypothetical protein
MMDVTKEACLATNGQPHHRNKIQDTTSTSFCTLDNTKEERRRYQIFPKQVGAGLVAPVCSMLLIPSTTRYEHGIARVKVLLRGRIANVAGKICESSRVSGSLVMLRRLDQLMTMSDRQF